MKITGSLFPLKGTDNELRLSLACFPKGDVRYQIKARLGEALGPEWMKVSAKMNVRSPLWIHVPSLSEVSKVDQDRLRTWQSEGVLCQRLEREARRSAALALPTLFASKEVKKMITADPFPEQWRLHGVYCQREPKGRVVLVNDRTHVCWDLYQQALLRNWRGKVDGDTMQILANGRKFIHLKDPRRDYKTGAWKVCKFALDTLTNRRIARLVIKYDKNPKGICALIDYGQRVLKALRGIPGIMQQYGCVNTANRWGEKEIVLYQRHYRLGDLHEFLKFKVFPEERIKIMRDLLSTLSLMHDRRVYHRDLKEENILVDNQGHLVDVAICDLDLAWMEGEDVNAYCGTRHAFAPERAYYYVHRETPMTEKDLEMNDSWGMGLVLYSLYHEGHLPSAIPRSRKFKHETIEKLAELSKSTEPLYPEPDDPFEKIIWNMLQIDPAKRITVKEALSQMDEILLKQPVEDATAI